MNVLVISSVYPSQAQPSLGVPVRERVRHVAAHCQVRVVAPIPWFPLNRWLRGRERTGAPRVENQDGITVYHPRFFSIPGVGKSLDGILYFVRMLPFLLSLRRTYPFDLLDAHFAYPDGLAAVLLGTVFGRPTFITLRGDEARLSRHRLRRLQMRFALRRARVIAVSDSLRRFTAQIGIDPERVTVIANGIDASHFRPLDQRAARERLGLPLDRPILISVGTLIERKGHHRVIEALPAILGAHSSLLYVIVGGEVPGGDQNYRAVIDERVHRAGLDQHVRIVSSQPHADVPLWLAAADLFCLATRWEGWCNALVEALACGLPVVTTRVGGNQEFVHDERNGITVPYWDGAAFAAAVGRALTMQWDRAAIAADTAERGWERVAQQVLDEFHRAIAPARPRQTKSASAAPQEREA